MGDEDALIEACMADLLAGANGVREQLRELQRNARARGDAAATVRAAMATVLHTLCDFADFRGLAEALADFAAAEAAGLPLSGPDALRADAVRLGRPTLDHQHASDDPALQPVRERLFAALRDGSGLAPDERLLMAKVMVDHDGMVNNHAAAERLLTLMQDSLPQASPRWQASWWRLAAQNYEYRGRTELARAAAQQLQQLAARLAQPELDMALACEEMRQALHGDDRPRAERAYRVIEHCRPLVRPALLPHGLRAQVSLLLRRGDLHAALERTQLILSLCEDHAVPERDRAGYVEQRAHALSGLGRHDEAVALLESLRPSQVAGQAGVLEAVIAMARAVRALAEDRPDARETALRAIALAAEVGFHRFLVSFPARASQIAAIGLAAGVQTEFLTHAIRARRLAPPEPKRENWPWALHVQVLGRLQVRRDGVPLGGEPGKAQKKPMELLALLAAHPEGLDAETLIDALWPSLDAEAPKSSLEMAISRLRKALDLPEAVRVADGRVSLHPALVWTDVAAFEVAARASDVAAALAVYRGPLLQGERVTGLAALARERLAARLAACVLQAAGELRHAGRAADALALIGQGLAADPQATALQAALRA
jgi:hypothetical protein